MSRTKRIRYLIEIEFPSVLDTLEEMPILSTSFAITPKDLFPIPKDCLKRKTTARTKKSTKRVAKNDKTRKTDKKSKTKIKKLANNDDEDPECIYCGEVWSQSRHEDG